MPKDRELLNPQLLKNFIYLRSRERIKVYDLAMIDQSDTPSVTTEKETLDYPS
jgi:hypothetical protein